MKALDIINRLKQVIPRYTNLFCDELNIDSLTFSAGFVTCHCIDNHDLAVGDEIFISGASTPSAITSLTRSGSLVTAITNNNHDLTRGYQENVNIIGANQSEYNGEHPLVDVPNRKTFIFSVTGTPTTPATGTIKLLESLTTGYNGLHIVSSIVDDKTFKYSTPTSPGSPATGSIKLRKNITITGDVTIDRFLQSYTKQEENKFYLVVTLGGSYASKDRFTLSDATSTSTSANIDVRLRIIDPFSIYIVAPSSNALTAMTIRDGMDSVFNALNSSVLFRSFPTHSASQTNMGVTFVSHDMHLYDVARYIHEFKYEFVYDLVREDGSYDDDSVAFRDIDLHFNSYLNTKHNEIMHKLVDLDDQPLP